MTVGRDYLLEKKGGPSKPRLFLDHEIVPFIVNVAGAMEGVLARASNRTGIRPAVLLAASTGLLSFGLLWLRRRSADENRWDYDD